MPTNGGDTVYHTFMAGDFRDTHQAADGVSSDSSEPSNTVHGFWGEQFSRDDLRLDWILTLNGSRTIQTRSYAIVRDAEPPLYPSDHYPVIADLTIS
jgi:endonuclease/exonuclease/phosphatase family metal-dependent hydrolase